MLLGSFCMVSQLPPTPEELLSWILCLWLPCIIHLMNILFWFGFKLCQIPRCMHLAFLTQFCLWTSSHPSAAPCYCWTTSYCGNMPWFPEAFSHHRTFGSRPTNIVTVHILWRIWVIHLRVSPGWVSSKSEIAGLWALWVLDLTR